jgi:hypothetical protein
MSDAPSWLTLRATATSGRRAVAGSRSRSAAAQRWLRAPVAEREHGREPATLDPEQLVLDDRVHTAVDSVKAARGNTGLQRA